MNAVYRRRGYKVDDADYNLNLIYLVDVETSERIAVKLSDHKLILEPTDRQWFQCTNVDKEDK